jgi:putative solute:sodium symporter small subunit
MNGAQRQRLWSRTRRLTAWLLAVWLLINLLGPWFAHDLNQLQLLGFPLGYWIAAQGALLAYLAIIVIYVVCMDRMEARYLRDPEVADDEPGEEGPA